MAKKKVVRSSRSKQSSTDIEITVHPDKFRAVMEVMSFFVEEVTLQVTKSHIFIVATDSSRVGMVIAKLRTGFFTTYNVPIETTWVIRIDDLVKILKRKGKAAMLEISHKPKDLDNTVKFSFRSAKRARRTFKLKTMVSETPLEDEDDAQGVETLRNAAEAFTEQIIKDGGVTFEIETEALDEIVKDALIIDDVIHFDLDNDTQTLTISTRSDTGSQEVIFDGSEEEIENFQIDSTGTALFSLPFLENILKARSLADEFNITTKEERPLLVQIEFKAPSDKLTTQPGYLNYIIAPRVQKAGEDMFDEDDFENFADSLGNEDDEDDPEDLEEAMAEANEEDEPEETDEPEKKPAKKSKKSKAKK